MTSLTNGAGSDPEPRRAGQWTVALTGKLILVLLGVFGLLAVATVPQAFGAT